MPFGKEFRVLFDPGAEKCLVVVRRLRDGLCTDENRAEIRFGLVFYVRIGADRDVGSTRMRYLSATYSALLCLSSRLTATVSLPFLDFLLAWGFSLTVSVPQHLHSIA
jgi:hypothetical protein